MSFSSFIASIISPLIFNFPPMNACVGLSSPLNIFTKSSESKFMVQLASPPGKEPLPTLPEKRETRSNCQDHNEMKKVQKERDFALDVQPLP